MLIMFLHLILVDVFFFFFNDTATTEIYTLSLHDALPFSLALGFAALVGIFRFTSFRAVIDAGRDRKSTRLNSSHLVISYAVFCLKKKKKKKKKYKLKIKKRHITTN